MLYPSHTNLCFRILFAKPSNSVRKIFSGKQLVSSFFHQSNNTPLCMSDSFPNVMLFLLARNIWEICYFSENKTCCVSNTYKIMLGKCSENARNFYHFPSIHKDSFPIILLMISPFVRSRLSRYSILFIFCLSLSWSDSTSHNSLTISFLVKLP